MLEFGGDLDLWLEPEDEPEVEACDAKCPNCGGMARGVRRVLEQETEETDAVYDITGIACDECGHLEGDECYEQ